MVDKRIILPSTTDPNLRFNYGTGNKDKYSNRDYKNTNSDIAAMEQGLEQVEDYPVFNDIELQADIEKTIKDNPVAQVGLRYLMQQTGGDMSKVLQNYLSTDSQKDLNLDKKPKKGTLGYVSTTIGSPDPSIVGPKDFNTMYEDDPENILSRINPNIRLKLSELAEQDSTIRPLLKEYKNNKTKENRDKLVNKIKAFEGTPISQSAAINHELIHYGIRALNNEGLLDKKTKDYLIKQNKKREHKVIGEMSTRGVADDPVFGSFVPEGIENIVPSDDLKRLDLTAEQWLKDNSPPVQEYDSSGVLKAEEPPYTTPYTGKLPGRIRDYTIEEEMYDGAIPAGLAKGGDIMPMEQQMQMFAIGGLDDDGMSRDPISGNEIPPGSMANEVRDDVDAKLSDGEYVVPANVVRFFGVKFFEDLRTQAMQGLSNMEANGRIGGEPVPSDMPMQDQMAEVMPDVSDGEMEMLQGLMNEGGYVRGYAPGGAVVPKDVDLENPTPFNPNPFATVGSSFFEPYNPNLTPDPNAPAPTPVDPGPNPESGISFVTMVNPATGAIQIVQFMGGNPVDEAAYNKLLSNGFFIQGSPELAAEKQRMGEDPADNDPTTRPHPMEASISELGQLIAESSKGGKSLLEMIPGITGAVTGKLATDYRNDISRALAKTIADTNLSDAQRNAAQLLQNVWTNSDLSAKQRKEAIAKSGIFKHPSFKNALGKKAGKYMSENWYGLATKEQLEKQFGSEKATTKAMTDALNLTEKKFKVDDGFYGSDDKDDGFVVTDPKTGKTKDYRFGVTGSGGVDGDSGGETLGEFGGSGPNVDSSGNITNDNNDNTSGGSDNNNTSSGGQDNNPNAPDPTPSDYEKQEDPDFGLMNKGGIIKKRKKKTKKY